MQNSYKRRPRTALYFHICINSHWLDSNFICGSWMFFLMLINVHHLKFQCMHFEHWYLEPCIYMHNIRVKKTTTSISSVKIFVCCANQIWKIHIACIYIYISIEKSLRYTQSLNEWVCVYSVYYSAHFLHRMTVIVTLCTLVRRENMASELYWILTPCWALIVLIKQSRWTVRQLRETFYLCQQVA